MRIFDKLATYFDIYTSTQYTKTPSLISEDFALDFRSMMWWGRYDTL